MTVLVSTHYMDEAERCHRIAYIAYGRLLAAGHDRRGGRAVRARHLAGRGAGARRAWRAALRGQPGVEMVAPFGTALHVSGTDAAALEARDRALARRSRR